MTHIGFGIIAVAWAIQFIQTHRHGKQLSQHFLVVYGAGTSLIILDAIQTTALFSIPLWINIISLTLIILLLVCIHEK